MSDYQTSDAAPVITHDPSAGRFETVVDGITAELDYVRVDGRMVISHTGVPSAIGGRGIGGDLVSAAVDVARLEELTVVPECWYARQWLERHPEVAGTVTVG